MSHIPAHAMPHAAPHHPDAPPAEPVQEQGMTTAMEPTASATSTDSPLAPPPVTAARPAPTQAEASPTPVSRDGAAKADVAKSRTGWGSTALAAGGVALIAGLVTVGVPLLRGRVGKEARER